MFNILNQSISAAAGGHTEVLRLLINQSSKGVEVPINHRTSTGWTPLHSALARKYLECAKVLVYHGALLDIPNNSGFTCRNGYEELLNVQGNHQNAKQKIIQFNGISIQISSDIHLEFYGDKSIDYSQIIIPSAPILALLGDIGIPESENTIYRDFLLHMADKFELVLVIAGNHGTFFHVYLLFII